MANPRSRKGPLVFVISTSLLTSLQSSVTILHQVWCITFNFVISNQAINTVVMTCQYCTLGVDHTLLNWKSLYICKAVFMIISNKHHFLLISLVTIICFIFFIGKFSLFMPFFYLSLVLTLCFYLSVSFCLSLSLSLSLLLCLSLSLSVCVFLSLSTSTPSLFSLSQESTVACWDQ